MKMKINKKKTFTQSVCVGVMEDTLTNNQIRNNKIYIKQLTGILFIEKSC